MSDEVGYKTYQYVAKDGTITSVVVREEVEKMKHQALMQLPTTRPKVYRAPRKLSLRERLGFWIAGYTPEER